MPVIIIYEQIGHIFKNKQGGICGRFGREEYKARHYINISLSQKEKKKLECISAPF